MASAECKKKSGHEDPVISICIWGKMKVRNSDQIYKPFKEFKSERGRDDETNQRPSLIDNRIKI